MEGKMTMSTVTINRPWDYSVRGRIALTDAEVETLVDRFVPARVGVYYEGDAHQLTLSGYTTDGTRPWAAIGWVMSVVSAEFGDRFALLDANIHEGDTDAEVVEFLREIGLYDGPEGHGYEGSPR
jgi:hypothetical protein